MRHYLIFIALSIWFPLKISAQHYFQQSVSYKISVTLNDSKNELSAFESVEYINNSPDTLSFLFFHLWPNAYSNNTTELAKEIFSNEGKSKLFENPGLRGFIDSLDFRVNGTAVKWNLTKENVDICIINLNNPLKSGDTVLITTPFHVKIPEAGISRLGHSGQSYQISQWYPKPAVYDNSGWHEYPYLDQGEFYSEFGNFEVDITLPENYIVGASGDLQNADEIERLDGLSHNFSMVRKLNMDSDYFPPSSEQLKTLSYKGAMIHDFAWFADKRFNVMKSSIRLPESKRHVTTWAMFTDQDAYYWKNAINYIDSVILVFSGWIGDYPYNSYTAVQGPIGSGSGMEYPGLTVIGELGNAYMLEDVLAHEICHSWFYSAIGTDERRYPFMDESIASSYEYRYMGEKYPDKKLWEILLGNLTLARVFNMTSTPAQVIQELDWLIPARKNAEQPIDLPATEYTSSNYRSMIYSKGALGFNYLRFYLGTSGFDSIMKNYYLIWKEKHPVPEDLRAVFESSYERDLSWFFDDFLGTCKRLDYKMVRFKGGELVIKNRLEMHSPLSISGFTGDSVSLSYWEHGFKGKKDIYAVLNNISETKIDPDDQMTELYKLNNDIRRMGLFRKSPPLQLHFLYAIENPDARNLIYLPAVGWTKQGGFLAGMALNNGTLLPKPVEYSLIPFYAFRNSVFSGYGKVVFNAIPYDKFIRLASFSIEGTRFPAPGSMNYVVFKVGFNLFFRQHEIKRGINNKLSGFYIAASDLSQIDKIEATKVRSYLQFGYSVERTTVINPFTASVNFESGRSYQRTSLEIRYRYSYYGKNRGLDTRMFAGTMIRDLSTYPYYGFAASGRSGNELYLYQGFFPDRFTSFPKTFWSRQMNLLEGGLATFVNDSVGYSPWIFSVSLNSSLPQKISWLPVKPYLTVLLNDRGENTGKSAFFFESGIKTGIWNFFEFYIPFIVSGNISSIQPLIKNRIRFVLNLDFLESGKMNRFNR